MVQRSLTVYKSRGQALDEAAEQDVCCKVPQTCTALKPNVLQIDVMQTISCRATTTVSAQDVGQQATSHETKLTSLKTMLCFKQQRLYFVFQTRNNTVSMFWRITCSSR